MESENEINNIDWFQPVDLNTTLFQNMSKEDLINLLHQLNIMMIESLKNWEGG